jgi:outer membrane protein
MTKLLVSAALAATLVMPAAAGAQALSPAVVAVVDLNKVTTDCNACKTASATLRSQAQALEAREKALGDPLKTEAAAIQKAIDALGDKQPDAALEARIKAFQTRQQTGAQELSRKQQDLQRTQQYIQQQIASKLGPIYQQVMQRRGANVMVEIGSTLATASSIDVSADVTAALNGVLPTISTTPPAAPQQPQGR